MNVFWIARDEDGSLCLYSVKPLRDCPEGEYGTFYSQSANGMNNNRDWIKIDDRLYPEVTWENSPMMLKPTEEEQP